VAELVACVLSMVGVQRGDLLPADHPTVIGHPEVFAPWPGPPELVDGHRMVACVESFASGDELIHRGELFDCKALIVRRVPQRFIPWTPPPIGATQ
jgi:hypothetical protein